MPTQQHRRVTQTRPLWPGGSRGEGREPFMPLPSARSCRLGRVLVCTDGAHLGRQQQTSAIAAGRLRASDQAKRAMATPERTTRHPDGRTANAASRNSFDNGASITNRGRPSGHKVGRAPPGEPPERPRGWRRRRYSQRRMPGSSTYPNRFHPGSLSAEGRTSADGTARQQRSPRRSVTCENAISCRTSHPQRPPFRPLRWPPDATLNPRVRGSSPWRRTNQQVHIQTRTKII